MPRKNRLPRNRRIQRLKGMPVKAERTLMELWAGLLSAPVETDRQP